MPSVLALDLGTSGLKLAVVDERGNVLASATAPIATTFLPGGGAEQDADGWWDVIGELSRATVRPEHDVVAVAVTSQYMSIVAIDEVGRPLAPVVMWMDSRGAAHYRYEGDAALHFERHGLAPLGFGDPVHMALVRAAWPDAYARAAALVEPVDALNARLTGRICATQTTAMPLFSVDNRRHGATAHDPELIAAAGLDASKLPSLVPFDEPIGPLTAEAARHLGLGADVVVMTGTVDSITSGIGCGVIDSDSCALIIGTTSVIVTNIDHKDADLERGLVSVPSPLHDRWFVMAENGVGGKALDQWLRVLDQPFEDAERDAATIEPGAGGVLYFPWLSGSISPASDGRMRAGFANMGLDTTRAHMTRAVYEGVALNAAWLLPYVGAFAQRAWPSIRFGGGGAGSPLWGQILANAFGVTVERLADPSTTNARGAAFLAHAQLGHIGVDDIPSLVRVAEVHEPEPEAAAIHARQLEHFVDFHAAAKPFYAALNRRR